MEGGESLALLCAGHSAAGNLTLEEAPTSGTSGTRSGECR